MLSYRKRGSAGIPAGGLTVEEGGTIGLNYVGKESLGQPGGVAQLDDQGRILEEAVDIEILNDYVSLIGPLTIQKNENAEYKISNYGFIRNYEIESDYGLISRNGDTINFVPHYSGKVTFKVNKRVFEVGVMTDEIEKPTIDQVGYSRKDSGTLTIKTSLFRSKTVADTHKLSFGRGSKKANMGGDLVFSTESIPVNPRLMQQGGVYQSGAIHLQARHEGVVLGSTDWGDVKSYLQPQALYPYMVEESFVNPTLEMTIPEGGSITILTDTGFEQVYYETQTVTLNQLTCKKMLAVGKGGPSTKEYVSSLGDTPGYYRDVEGPPAYLKIVGQTYNFPGDPDPGEHEPHIRPISNTYRPTNGTDGSFGKSSSVSSNGKRMVVGSPDGSWGGQLHVFEKLGDKYIPTASWLASVPESKIHLTIPAGGSVTVFGKTYTSSNIIDIPEGTKSFLVEGKGGTGSTKTTPGQPKIDPSDPVYEKRTLLHAAGSWRTENEDHDHHHTSPLKNSKEEAEADRLDWLNPNGPQFTAFKAGMTNSTSSKVTNSGYYDETVFDDYNSKEDAITYLVSQAKWWNHPPEGNTLHLRPNIEQIVRDVIGPWLAPLGPYLRPGCTGWHSSYIGVVFNPTLSPGAESKVHDNNNNGKWGYIRRLITNSKALPLAPIEEEYDHFLRYNNPGQPYIPPSTVKVKGEVTTVRMGGRTITFEGGDGGPATSQQAYLSSDIKNLGENVYISKDSKVIFAGAPNEEENTLKVGGMYEALTGYEPEDQFPGQGIDRWSPMRRISSPSPVDGSRFGESVCSSADGGRVFVGAPGENAVYYFRRQSEGLEFKQRITLTAAIPSDGFGKSLVCSDNGEYLFVGSPKSRAGEGNVFIFQTTDGERYLPLHVVQPSVGNTIYGFEVPAGGSLEVEQYDSTGILIRKDSHTGQGTFALQPTTTLLNCRGKGQTNSANNTKLTMDAITYEFYGAAIGAPGYTYLSVPVLKDTKGLGLTIDASSDGNHLWVGLPLATVSKQGEGLVCHFKRNGAIWVEESRIVCPTPFTDGHFGNNLECSDNGLTVAIGFPGNQETNGEVVTLKLDSKGKMSLFGTYYQELGDPVDPSEGFGSEVSISGTGDVTIASNPGLSNGEGAVYAFINL